MMITTSVASEATPSSFSYQSASPHGPSDWGNLNMTNQCGGKNQSPIAVKNTDTCDFYDDFFKPSFSSCSDSRAKFLITDHNVQASIDSTSEDDTEDDCIVQIPETSSATQKWKLMQFHIHSTQEHVIHGPLKKASAELHLVHEGIRTKGALAVIAVRFYLPMYARDHPILESWLVRWQQQQATVCLEQNPLKEPKQKMSSPTPFILSNSSYNIYDILPNTSAYYQYFGSLTTPPCSEIVHWSVAEDRVPISKRQWKLLRSLIVNYRDPNTCQLATVASKDGSTNRPLQPRNGRLVFKMCSRERLLGAGVPWKKKAIFLGSVALFFLIIVAFQNNRRHSTGEMDPLVSRA